MPFTPSHAVVALPFVRTPLLPAAIAIGAMTPDLPLFVRGMPITYQATHTNVVLSTVVAFVLLALWYALLRPAVRELSPHRLAARLPDEWDRVGAMPWRGDAGPGAAGGGARRTATAALLIVVSLVIGVVSHIVWDAFTHEGRWGVAALPGLGESWGPLPGYKWLQYASGALGLVALAVAGVLWLRRRVAASVSRVLPASVRVAWWISLPVALAVAWGAGLLAYGPLSPEWTVRHLAYRVLPPACAVWGALTLALCAVVLIRRARGRRAMR